MPKFKVSVEINQPPDVIDRALEDPDNMVQWTSDLEWFEVVEGRQGEAGAVGRAHYTQRGKPYIMEDVLEYCVPGKKYVSRVSGGGMTARVETLLSPTEEGTEMSISWSGGSRSFPGRLILPLMGPFIKRRAQADLDTFKRLVEIHGAHFPKDEAPAEIKPGD